MVNSTCVHNSWDQSWDQESSCFSLPPPLSSPPPLSFLSPPLALLWLFVWGGGGWMGNSIKWRYFLLLLVCSFSFSFVFSGSKVSPWLLRIYALAFDIHSGLVRLDLSAACSPQAGTHFPLPWMLCLFPEPLPRKSYTFSQYSKKYIMRSCAWLDKLVSVKRNWK